MECIRFVATIFAKMFGTGERRQLTSAAVWPNLEQCVQRHGFTCPVSGKAQFEWVSAHCGTCGSSASAVASTFKMTPGLIGWNDDGTPASQIYAKVVNKRATTGNNTITVTLTSVKLED